MGINVRLMVFNETGERGKGEEMVLVNPRIISTSKSSDFTEEGCLSFKDGDSNVLGDVEVRASVNTASNILFWCLVRKHTKL